MECSTNRTPSFEVGIICRCLEMDLFQRGNGAQIQKPGREKGRRYGQRKEGAIFQAGDEHDKGKYEGTEHNYQRSENVYNPEDSPPLSSLPPMGRFAPRGIIKNRSAPGMFFS